MTHLPGLDAAEHLPRHLKPFLKTITFRVVQTREELEQAARLVHQEYAKRNYVAGSTVPLKLSRFNALPQTTTFIALMGDEVIGTVTLIPDSPLGLPMDSIYREELEGLRRQGRRLAEVSMLAVRTDLFGRGVFLMLNSKKLFLVFNLFKLLFDYVRFLTSITTLCIAVHPKHDLIYRFLFFHDLAGERVYPGANKNPAIAKILDLHLAVEECRAANRLGIYRLFVTKRSKPDQLAQKLLLTPEDLQHLFVKQTSVLERATPEQLRHLQQCYPSYRFSEILGRDIPNA
jgi:hypothetical protein